MHIDLRTCGCKGMRMGMEMEKKMCAYKYIYRHQHVSEYRNMHGYRMDMRIGMGIEV